MRRFLLAVLAVLLPLAANAQAWTVGPPTVVWVASPTLGLGLDSVPEVYLSSQGGDPPWMLNEPADINENNYTRSQWFNSNASSTGTDEAKLRIICGVAGFGVLDPIVAYGGTGPHDHVFFGSPPSATSTFTSLRSETAKSTCSGGPLNRSSYWASAWERELPKNGVVSGGVTLINPGVTVANQPGGVVIARAKPNNVTFYYTIKLSDRTKTIRIPNGFGGIFGVNPSDPKNSIALAAIPNGANWNKETTGGNKRYDGWGGWQCFDVNSGTNIVPNPASDADINPDTGFPRQWLNMDGSDPWYEGGVHKCDSTLASPKVLIKNLVAPKCVDGTNLTSPNGRGQWVQPIYSVFDGSAEICPDHFFLFPDLTVKEEYPALTHAQRQRSYLSSDRMSADPAMWLPNGSTAHADLITAWDSVIRNLWHRDCLNMYVNGTTGETQACNNSTVSMLSPTRLLVGENAPDPALANSPVISTNHYETAATKVQVVPFVSTGTKVDAMGVKHH